MSSHIRITFYVGLSRSTDAGSIPTDLADSRAGAVARFFAWTYPSGTLKRADGYWEGTAEPSLTFEVVTADEPTARPKAYDLAARLSVLHRQAGIGVAIDPVVFRVVGPDDLPSVFHGRYHRDGATLESLTAAQELSLNAGARDRDAEEAAGRG